MNVTKQPAPDPASERQFLDEMSHALAGWSDPVAHLREEENALPPPGEFLPVFEHFGMMPELDRWVARHVIDHRSRATRAGRGSIDVPGRTLADPEFPGFVADAPKAALVAVLLVATAIAAGADRPTAVRAA